MKLRSIFLLVITVGVLLCSYPAFVLGYTWSHVASADFSGGRHGPLDAYRHTLASSVVAFTLSPRVVDWVTLIMERDARRSSAMDRHNNRIGAMIGAKVQSFSDLEPTVRNFITQGTIEATDLNQSTWLPPVDWREGWLW